MIIEEKPLSMSESSEYLGKSDSEKETTGFVKKFVKIKPEKAKELRKEIEGLDFLKVKAEHIAKVIDLIPETEEELNKIFVDISLNEEEVKALLEKIKSFK